MQINCPCCHARFGLEAALADEAAREMTGLLAQLPVELSRPLASYLGLFRSATRMLAWDRATRLAKEILELTSDRPALVRALVETVETMRDKQAKGGFKPLSNHNYLKCVLGSVTRTGRTDITLAEPVAARGPRTQTAQGLVALESMRREE